jgi:cell division protein FtsB
MSLRGDLMRIPAVVFTTLLLALQYPLWFGHGGLLRVHELEHQLADARARNALQKQQNLALEAEVRDLSTGSDAIEERARADLGMVREGETWFRYAIEARRSSP